MSPLTLTLKSPPTSTSKSPATFSFKLPLYCNSPSPSTTTFSSSAVTLTVFLVDEYTTEPSARISTPEPELCLIITLSEPGVSSYSTIWPDAVSLTCELGYVDTDSSFKSKLISFTEPPSSTLTLLNPLAISLTEEISSYSILGKTPLGSEKPFSLFFNELAFPSGTVKFWDSIDMIYSTL